VLVLTNVQKIALTIAVLGFLAGAGTQLTDIFAPFGSAAPVIVKEIVSMSSFVSGILGVGLSFISGQASLVKNVQAMPGVETIIVNKNASPALATLAIDPTQPKIEVKSGAENAVNATAAAAS